MLVMTRTIGPARFPSAAARVVAAVTTESSRIGGPEPPSATEEDRVVSRRVDNPTAAGPEDERAYRAADPDADPATPDRSSDGGGGSTSERAERDLDSSDESEPTRSE